MDVATGVEDGHQPDFVFAYDVKQGVRKTVEVHATNIGEADRVVFSVANEAAVVRGEVAREFEAVYVWGAQTGGARRLGVPEETIAAIRENHSRGLPPEDAEIVEFTRQLLRRHRVDEASFTKLQSRFGSDGLIQLTGAIGYYSMLAMTVNACELEAAPGAEVLQT